MTKKELTDCEKKTNTFVQKSLNCYNKQYFYHNSVIITLNLLRRDEKGIDGVRKKTNTFVQKSLNCYNKQYFYHNSIIITLNLLRRDEKGIDGVRKKQILLYRIHLTVNRTFSTFNDVSI